MEHKWTFHAGEETVTVKYTDKRKFDEMVQKNKELYPQIYFEAKIEQMREEMEKLKKNNEDLQAEVEQMKKKIENLQDNVDQMTSSKKASFLKYFGKKK